MDDLFFIASKVLWLLLRPGSLLVGLLLLGTVLLYRRQIRWGRRCVLVTLVAMVAIGLFPIERAVLLPLEKHYPVGPPAGRPDGIIVLGGGELPLTSTVWGRPEVNEAGDRFLAALDLAQRFPEIPVIFTGGNGRLLGGVAGADIAEALLLSAGLSPERLVLEGASRNTAENAARTFEMTPRAASGRWILVTSAFHMHRAVGAFCAAGWRNLVPWPVDFRTDGPGWQLEWNLAQSLERLNTGLREWVGVLAYRATGRLQLPSNVPGCVAPPQRPPSAVSGSGGPDP